MGPRSYSSFIKFEVHVMMLLVIIVGQTLSLLGGFKPSQVDSEV